MVPYSLTHLLTSSLTHSLTHSPIGTYTIETMIDFPHCKLAAKRLAFGGVEHSVADLEQLTFDIITTTTTIRLLTYLPTHSLTCQLTQLLTYLLTNSFTHLLALLVS
jgi:hypothetical protein